MLMSMDELLKALNELKELEEKTPDVFKKLDSEFWLIPALMDLYQMCKDYKQVEYSDEIDIVGYSPARKVVKINRYIPKYYMDKYQIDSVQMSGMFIAIDGLFISEKLMNEYFEKRMYGKGKLRYNPVEDLNLPSEYNYATIRRIPNGMGFVLKDDGIVPDIIFSPYHWEFLGLEL